MSDVPALSAAVTGAALGLGLIVAIGAQNAFVLRQGLRREHVGPVVALCALCDAVLMTAGVAGLLRFSTLGFGARRLAGLLAMRLADR